jgi:Na+/serine symporter
MDSRNHWNYHNYFEVLKLLEVAGFRTQNLKKISVLLAFSIIGVFWAYLVASPLILVLPIAFILYAAHELLTPRELIAPILFGLLMGLVPEVIKWLMIIH